MQRSIVDLPEPDGPATTIASPAAIARSMLVEHDVVAEALADVAQLDERRGGLAVRHGAHPTVRPGERATPPNAGSPLARS